MAIDEYGRRRDFSRTPEPAPSLQEQNSTHSPDTPPYPRTFVIHRHEARSLHYDLRIRIEEALACWAIPKGFSYEPSDKRLAVHTEDHPKEYETFEGVIPKGEYGAGTMKIWDSGIYELLKSTSMEEAIEKGEIKLVLKGRHLRGEWHLVRTKANNGKDWLLFKARDRYIGSGNDLFGGSDLSLAEMRPFPSRTAWMEPAETCAPFSDREWLFETAFPGKRVTVLIRQGEAKLTSSDGDLSGRFPSVTAGLAHVRTDTAILDGVLVATGPDGVPSTHFLEEQLSTGKEDAALYIFDVLYAEDWDLRKMPLKERKAVLRALIPDKGRIMAVDPIIERGEDLAVAAARSGFTTLIAKRADSPYKAGVSDSWRRVIIPRNRKPRTGRASAESSERSAPIIISHPRKVYWPDQGYTKEDLIIYYDRMAPLLLPYLENRPLHLFRWPDGVRGKSFYQKRLPEGLPEWVETVNVARPHEDQLNYIVCNDRRTLLVLINTGSIDLHPWLSRKDTLESPDWTVLDLDPKGAPFEDVARIARDAGKLLRGIGLEPYLKTSGSTGLHICIPLKPGYTYDQSRMFAEAVARILIRDHPRIATIERVVGRREGKVYIDFLQNRREQTIVPPYVVRPVEAATVSMPILWDELDDVHLSDFTLRTAPDRVEKVGDLFRTALRSPQDLGPAIDALSGSGVLHSK